MSLNVRLTSTLAMDVPYTIPQLILSTERIIAITLRWLAKPVVAPVRRLSNRMLSVMVFSQLNIPTERFARTILIGAMGSAVVADVTNHRI
jgi:hypothetical protein